MYKQLKITLIINKLLLGLKELILILYSTLLWYSYCYIYLYVCLYIHECICICAHAHVHTHVTLCENVSTCLLLNMGVLHWECCMMYGKQSAVKYGNKLDLIWFDLKEGLQAQQWLHRLVLQMDCTHTCPQVCTSVCICVQTDRIVTIPWWPITVMSGWF